MKHDIQLVVFDIAGTTVKDNGEVAMAFQKAMAQNGYQVPVEKINTLMGYRKPEAIKMMLEEYEQDITMINAEYINSIHNKFLDLMVAYYSTTNDLQALPHVEEVFTYLRNNHIKIGLDTGFSKEITDVIIERLGWLKDGKIDYVVSSDEVLAGRPKPYMIQKMMMDAGIEDSKKVIKLGDTEVDINEGKNAGCLYSIGVTTGAFTRGELVTYEPSFIIDGLDELIGIVSRVNGE